jgi:F-type H+-transporting ATPase subunit b
LPRSRPSRRDCRRATAALKAAAAQAEEAAAARRAQSQREAAALLNAARTTLAAERTEASVKAREAAFDLGADIAARLLAEMPIKERGEAWLALIEKYLASLTQTEMDALARQLVDGAELKVVTVSALPFEIAEDWRARLQRMLGERGTIAFGVDRRLVAGAELNFPHAVLRFSWQSALEAMRAEMAGNGNPR